MRETTAISCNCCSCRSLTAGFEVKFANWGTSLERLGCQLLMRDRRLFHIGLLRSVGGGRKSNAPDRRVLVPILRYDQLISALQCVHPGEH